MSKKRGTYAYSPRGEGESGVETRVGEETDQKFEEGHVVQVLFLQGVHNLCCVTTIKKKKTVGAESSSRAVRRGLLLPLPDELH